MTGRQRKAEAKVLNRAIMKALYARKIEQGLCVYGGCKEVPDDGYQRCGPHLEVVRAAHGRTKERKNAAKGRIDERAENTSFQAKVDSLVGFGEFTRRCRFIEYHLVCVNDEHKGRGCQNGK